MEDTLTRLLDAETQAQERVDRAIAERDRVIAKARDEARAAEQRFEKRIPEIHRTFLDKAEQRAEQTVAELQRRCEEKQSELENLARERMDEAVEAATAIVLGRDRESS